MNEIANDRCQKTVWEQGWKRKCAHRAVPGTMLCKMHSPEAVAARRARLEAKWDAKNEYAAKLSAERKAKAEADARKLAMWDELLAALRSAHAALGHVHGAFGLEPLCPEGCDLAAVIARAEGR